MQTESFRNGCEDLTAFSFEQNVSSDDLAQYSPVFSNIIIYENVQSGIFSHGICVSYRGSGAPSKVQILCRIIIKEIL